MPPPSLPLRQDFDGRKLRLIAATERSLHVKARLMALAEIYDGNSRSHAAETGGITLQALRTWVVRFNAGGPEALRNNYKAACDKSERKMTGQQDTHSSRASE